MTLRLANAEGIPGTACAVVRDLAGAAHVLASYHVVFGAGAGPGEVVWALPDVGAPVVLGRAGRGQLGRITHARETHFVDCALVAIAHHRPDWVADALAHLPRAGGVATSGLAVDKRGGATGHTRGTVARVDYPDNLFIAGRSYSAPRQLLIESRDHEIVFCGPGDSGAAVCDETGRLVGLLWGSTAAGQGIASPIGAVLGCLEVDISNEEGAR